MIGENDTMTSKVPPFERALKTAQTSVLLVYQINYCERAVDIAIHSPTEISSLPKGYR